MIRIDVIIIDIMQFEIVPIVMEISIRTIRRILIRMFVDNLIIRRDYVGILLGGGVLGGLTACGRSLIGSLCGLFRS